MHKHSVKQIDNNENEKVKSVYDYIRNSSSESEENEESVYIGAVPTVGFDNLAPSQHEIDYDIGESSEGSKYFIPIVDDALKPKTNAQYASINEAEKMFRAYADNARFNVRIHAKKKNKHGDIQTRWFVCSREGNPNKKHFESMEIQPGERRYRNTNLKHCGCNACIKIHLTKDEACYEIYEFVEAHNHTLLNINDRRFSRKNTQMKYTDFKTVLNNSSYKVGARRVHRIQTTLNEGFEHTRVSEIDFKNFKRDAAACVGNKDAKMLINKLSNKRDIVPGNFFEYKCNEQELIAIFWADEVARINYKEFDDVISFDGTFYTNKHAMIFVPFLAVDNYKASVVVGSALISGEMIENFTWVLNVFLKCHEKQPIFVITDQYSAMKQAIPMVFTKAKHRLCMWHIMKKVPSKVSVALNQDPMFNKVINKLVCRNNSTNTVECECNLFTRNGYLCRHAFKIQSARVRYGEVDAEKDKCVIDVYSKVDDIINNARNDKSILARLERNLDKFMVDIEKEVPYEGPSQQKLDAIRDHLGVSIPDEVDILPPFGKRNKGCVVRGW
ncbi:protein FAR1-RELATED SEQUENCE 5-like [Cynara cardunculus var. scolymus]|uniref:protein FAR1-RELATED SEQUENCE 5-like n=1 Tax=Cynara cardunculus var. scolymus TaxID=59895 RepID=UPI000D62C7AD|nr:protein FAR1-RELATED SEQUENCE 5-like [Cynara cardunculus var. scolymus]